METKKVIALLFLLSHTKDERGDLGFTIALATRRVSAEGKSGGDDNWEFRI